LLPRKKSEVTIKKSAARKAGSTATVTKYKFKLRCSRYLYVFSIRKSFLICGQFADAGQCTRSYTFCLADADKADKLRQSLPPSKPFKASVHTAP
jgi:large subunit ribosomal protein L38e